MALGNKKKGWEGILEYPLGGRTEKPRQDGITFVSLKGYGIQGVKDLVRDAADYIDRVKLAFGTTLLYDDDLLREKIAILRAADIDVNPGGTCGEIAIYQGKYAQFLSHAKELGFSTIEVSDGTINVDDSQREKIVKMALDSGLKVVSEVGKKDLQLNLAITEAIRQIKRDLSFGVSKVTVESRGSARGIGVYDEKGKVKGDDVELILSEVDGRSLIWEAPEKDGQEYFIKRLGNNVNLGNIKPEDIIPLEGLRRGLRGDTFRMVVYQHQELHRSEGV